MIAQFVEFYNNEITVEEANTLMAPFECFSDNGAINVRELSMAFLLVAPGSESLEERVDAIFDLTDDDHSGFLTRDKIASTLRLVFLSSAKFLKAISQIRGNAEIFGCAAVIDRFVSLAPTIYNAEKIQGMVDRCFETCDADNDGKLSLAEWKVWFSERENLITAFGSGGDLLL